MMIYARLRAKRVLSRSIGAAWRLFYPRFWGPEQVFGALLTVALSLLAINQGGLSAVFGEISAAITFFTALGLATAVWAVLCILFSPVKAFADDRQDATWTNAKKLYHERKLVAVCPFTAEQRDYGAKICFEDAEPNSFVEYKIELYPDVSARASFFLEPTPGQASRILDSIKFSDGKGTVRDSRVGGSGRVCLTGKTAILRVILEPGTIPTVARVYMYSFDAGRAQ